MEEKGRGTLEVNDPLVSGGGGENGLVEGRSVSLDCGKRRESKRSRLPIFRDGAKVQLGQGKKGRRVL